MDNNSLILIVDDNEVSRQLLVSAVEITGLKVIQAVDGATGFNALKSNNVSVVIINHIMSPHDGMEFLRLSQSAGYRTPVVLITDDQSSDILIEAGKLGVSRILQKPVNPERIIKDIHKLLNIKKTDNNMNITEIRDNKFSSEELMDKALDLAARNVNKGNGGPFGAIVANSEGRIIGDGVNAITSRCDPMAHAEVMAIRKAADHLGRADLQGCSLYTTSEPTAIGQALIISVGIEKVYFGTTHEDVNSVRNARDSEINEEISKPRHQRKTEYIQIGKDKAINIVEKWMGLKDRIST